MYSNEKIRKDPCAGDCWGEPDWLQLKRTKNIVLQGSAGGSLVETKNLSIQMACCLLLFYLCSKTSSLRSCTASPNFWSEG